MAYSQEELTHETNQCLSFRQAIGSASDTCSYRGSSHSGTRETGCGCLPRVGRSHVYPGAPAPKRKSHFLPHMNDGGFRALLVVRKSGSSSHFASSILSPMM